MSITQTNYFPKDEGEAAEWKKNWQEAGKISPDNFIRCWTFKKEDIQSLTLDQGLSHIRIYLAVADPTQPHQVSLLAVGVTGGTDHEDISQAGPGKELKSKIVGSIETKTQQDCQNQPAGTLSNPEDMDSFFTARIATPLAMDWIRRYIEIPEKTPQLRLTERGGFEKIRAWRFPIQDFQEYFNDLEVHYIRFYLATKGNFSRGGLSHALAAKDIDATTIIMAGADEQREERIEEKPDWVKSSFGSLKSLYDFGSPCPPLCD